MKPLLWIGVRGTRHGARRRAVFFYCEQRAAISRQGLSMKREYWEIWKISNASWRCSKEQTTLAFSRTTSAEVVNWAYFKTGRLGGPLPVTDYGQPLRN